MRLLWWREALEKLSDGPPPDEPLLQAIADLDRDTKDWGAMAEGWHALLQDPIGDAELERFARQRGERLFALSAELLGGEDERIAAAGRAWALSDLGMRVGDAQLSEAARERARAECENLGTGAWPRPLRPLGALAAMARRDASSKGARRQGSPGRVARMAWHRLTGR